MSVHHRCGRACVVRAGRTLPIHQIGTFRIVFDDASVAAIADIDIAIPVHGHALGTFKLPSISTYWAELLEKSALTGKFLNAVVFAINHINITSLVCCDVIRPFEHSVTRALLKEKGQSLLTMLVMSSCGVTTQRIGRRERDGRSN